MIIFLTQVGEPRKRTGVVIFDMPSKYIYSNPVPPLWYSIREVK